MHALDLSKMRQCVTEVNVVCLETGNTHVLWAAFDFSQQDWKIEGESIVGDENCVGIRIAMITWKPYMHTWVV